MTNTPSTWHKAILAVTLLGGLAFSTTGHAGWWRRNCEVIRIGHTKLRFCNGARRPAFRPGWRWRHRAWRRHHGWRERECTRWVDSWGGVHRDCRTRRGW